jgi:ribonucleoside-diphosphate reductase alpha chain
VRRFKDSIDMSSSWLFVDQSQSLNLFMQNTEYSKTNLHFYAWQSGLKTECIAETKAAVDTIKFTLNNDKKQRTNRSDETSFRVAPVAQLEAEMSSEEYRAMVR